MCIVCFQTRLNLIALNPKDPIGLPTISFLNISSNNADDKFQRVYGEYFFLGGGAFLCKTNLDECALHVFEKDALSCQIHIPAQL